MNFEGKMKLSHTKYTVPLENVIEIFSERAMGLLRGKSLADVFIDTLFRQQLLEHPYLVLFMEDN